MRISDWSSDVCSSDLGTIRARTVAGASGQTVLSSASCIAPAAIERRTNMAIDRDQLARSATEKVAAGRTLAKRRTITEWAGRKKVSSADLDEIQEILEAAGIGLYPTPLRLCEPDDTVRISCGESPEVGLEFGSEAELREFLLTHHKRLHPLARLDSLKPEVRVPFDDSYVVVDLVGTASRGVVVIELKLGDGYYKIGSQIRRYIEEIGSASLRERVGKSV